MSESLNVTIELPCDYDKEMPPVTVTIVPPGEKPGYPKPTPIYEIGEAVDPEGGITTTDKPVEPVKPPAEPIKPLAEPAKASGSKVEAK
ncbi:MAG: hypothetical protein AB4352_21230 [Hormoscilla sp.]